ncbi:MAG: extracellular solute-binding protein [Bacilli bacterium]|nr:extracellular solute-binding protein [Bacilli bacterium]
MNKKRLVTFLSLPVLIATCLTACGTNDAVDVDRSLPKGDPPALTEILFWHCLGQDKTKVLNSVVDKFNLEYAGKYHVTAKGIAGDYDGIFTQIKTNLADGQVAAMAMGYPDHFSTYMGKDKDESYILRIDNFINDEEVGYTQAEIDDFVPEFLNEGKEYMFDGYWSMPMYKSTEIMYYNAGYMAGANEQTFKKLRGDSEYLRLYDAVDGVKNAKQEDLDALKTYVVSHQGYAYDIPETWDQLISWARQVKSDRAAQSVAGTFFPFGYDSDANLMISQFMQRNIPYTKNDEESLRDTDKHFLFNNQDARNFAQQLVNWIKEGLFVTKGTIGNNKYTNTYFSEEKIAMTIGSTGGSSYNVSSNFTVKLAPVPYTANGSNIKRYIQQGPSICFFNNDNDWIHKGAWLFYKFLADPDNNLGLALENSYDPVRMSSFDKPEYEEWIKTADEDMQHAIPVATKKLRQYYMTSPSFVGSSEARSEIGQILANIILSGYSITDAFIYAYNKCTDAA